MTPPQAKNAIFKALLEIVDPPPKPSEERRIRAFFENRCAYCSCEIPPGGRTGHIDHLIPRQQGGTNHLSNLVLACNICNGDEKLDQGWRDFINHKVLTQHSCKNESAELKRGFRRKEAQSQCRSKPSQSSVKPIQGLFRS